MNNSNTIELANAYVNGSHVVLYKTETPDFAVFTVLYFAAECKPCEQFFFDEQHESAARKKYASLIKKIAIAMTA